MGPAASSTGKSLLLDLANVNLNNRLYDRTYIERINAHRGHMALLDAIVWHSPDFKEAVAVKHNRADEFWVSGHFPGRPMLPGVVMVEAGAQLAAFIYNSRFEKPKLAAFTRINECTFRSAVTVGDDLYLLCKETKFNPRRFITLLQGLVNGKIAFEAEIAGMAID